MRTGRVVLIILAAGCLAVPVARAEVSVDGPGTSSPSWVSMCRGSSGDEGGVFPWGVHRQSIPASWVLNPDGDTRGDGHPAAAFPGSGFHPVVAWTTPVDGAGRDVVLAEWSGTGWSAPETVAGGVPDQRGPDVAALPGGGVVVTWWEDDGNVRQVWIRKRSATGAWADPVPVSPAGEDCRWPAVTVVDDVVVVGWLQDRGDGTRAVVVAREDEGWSPREIGSTAYEGEANDGNPWLELHAVGSVSWADWLLSGDRLATSRRDGLSGSWSSPDEIPCEDTPDGHRLARWEAKKRALGW